MEFDGLQRTLSKLFHVLHVAERLSVKEVLYFIVLYCIVLYLFASKQTHYITMDKSQQYTYHAKNTNIVCTIVELYRSS